MEAICILSFFVFFLTYYKNCECTVDLHWFFESRTADISLHKGNNNITELRPVLQRESQIS
jgi:hypothetical protein